MTCSQCRHEFCWLCTGPWAEHGERTGGFYSCNTYKKKKDAGAIDEAEQQRAHARASLERYMHYWQRWAEHDKARRTALKQMSQWESELLEVLSARTATPVSQLRFVLDAWREVVNCRRVLKWTYAVGFYSFDEPDGSASAADAQVLLGHKQFFEFTQQEAETALERMNHKVEKKLQYFVGNRSKVNPDEWARFREDLIGLTDVTENQFAKLVDFLEKGVDAGLAELRGVNPDMMIAEQAALAADAAANGGGSNGASGSGAASNKNNNSGKAGGAGDAGEASGSGAGGGGRRSARLSKKRSTSEGVVGDGADNSWFCETCSFVNVHGEGRCEMCNQLRKRPGSGGGGALGG